MREDEIGSILSDGNALPPGESEPLVALELETARSSIAWLMVFPSNQLALTSLDLGQACLHLALCAYLLHLVDLV